MIGGIGMPELIIILIIILIIFGAGKLPEIGAGLGKGIRSFKRSMSEPDEIDITPQKEQEKIDESAKKEDTAQQKTEEEKQPV